MKISINYDIFNDNFLNNKCNMIEEVKKFVNLSTIKYKVFFYSLTTHKEDEMIDFLSINKINYTKVVKIETLNILFNNFAIDYNIDIVENDNYKVKIFDSTKTIYIGKNKSKLAQENTFYIENITDISRALKNIILFEKVLLSNRSIKTILGFLQRDIMYENFYLANGAISETIYNYLNNRPLEENIKDYDILYYDEDTSYESEDVVIQTIKNKMPKKLGDKLDIKNEARVPLWFKDKFGYSMKPYDSVRDAIASFYSTQSCIGIRYINNKLSIYAPYGIDDIFNEIIRPIKKTFSKENYELRCKKLKDRWPSLRILSRED